MSKELVELENRVHQRTDLEPTAEFRHRVMSAVGSELARSCHASARTRDGRYWLAAAAAVLIVLNLSMVSASQDEFSVRPGRSLNQMVSDFHAIRQVEAQQVGIFR